MIQAAAAFGAGILARESCGQLPACSVNRADAGTAFKLSVQVHAATVPSLGEPGQMVKLKPRLGVSFGGAWKETEIADFVSDHDPVLFPGGAPDAARCEGRAAPSRKARPRHNGNLFTLSEPTCGVPLPFGIHAAASVDVVGKPTEAALAPGRGNEGPWRFGDTLTFSGGVCDILAGGLRLRLSAQNDVCLGPWHVELPSPEELGEAVVDLRHRVLPACAPVATARTARGNSAHDQSVIDGALGGNIEVGKRPPWWETPVLIVPLTRVNDNPHNGVEVSIVARVALSFSFNVDPERLLREAGNAERSLVDKVDNIVERFSRWMATPLGLSCSLGLENMACSQGMTCTKAANAPSMPRPLPSSARPSESDEPDAEAAPAYTVPAAADWAFKL